MPTTKEKWLEIHKSVEEFRQAIITTVDAYFAVFELIDHSEGIDTDTLTKGMDQVKSHLDASLDDARDIRQALNSAKPGDWEGPKRLAQWDAAVREVGDLDFYRQRDEFVELQEQILAALPSLDGEDTEDAERNVAELVLKSYDRIRPCKQKVGNLPGLDALATPVVLSLRRKLTPH